MISLDEKQSMYGRKLDEWLLTATHSTFGCNVNALLSNTDCVPATHNMLLLTTMEVQLLERMLHSFGMQRLCIVCYKSSVRVHWYVNKGARVRDYYSLVLTLLLCFVLNRVHIYLR